MSDSGRERWSHEQIEQLLEKHEDELLEDLGRNVGPIGLDAVPPSRRQLIARGRDWLEKNRESVCRSLYQSKTICDYVGGESVFGRVELVAAIGDAIITLLSGPALLTVSVVISKRGIQELCGTRINKS